MIKTLDLLDYLKYSYESTGNIAVRLRQNWNPTYGQLCILEAKGLVERQEIKLKKDMIMSIWRRRKDTTIPVIMAKIGRNEEFSDDEKEIMENKLKELNEMNKKDDISKEQFE